MDRKGKLLRVRVQRDGALRNKINRMGLRDQDRRAVQEDLHLIEAACASDRVVISRDDAAHVLLSSIAPSCPGFRNVMWCNPVTRGPQALEWLRDGAARVRAWQLRSARSPGVSRHKKGPDCSGPFA